MGRYLDRLPAHQPSAKQQTPSRAPRAWPLAGFVVLFGFFASTGLVAIALAHLVGGPAYERASTPARAGCLSTTVGALASSGAGGRARLCVSDGNVEWVLDLGHLAGGAFYAGWLATFERPDQCRFGALEHYVPGIRQPCTLSDLTRPDSQVHLQWVADTSADASGNAHLDGLVRDTHVPTHAQAWLLAAPTSLTHALPAQADWVARAVFDLP
ncbi:MAG TPA: hypothetical protein VFG86_15185 [Chloroflexota bacterium]|jgi:hypothetical protein|nr:hypothetical protein [Chloroflexota bacterium]